MLRIREVAKRLGVSIDTIRRMTRRGEFTAYHIGPRSIRYKAEEIEQYLAKAGGESCKTLRS